MKNFNRQMAEFINNEHPVLNESIGLQHYQDADLSFNTDKIWLRAVVVKCMYVNAEHKESMSLRSEWEAIMDANYDNHKLYDACADFIQAYKRDIVRPYPFAQGMEYFVRDANGEFYHAVWDSISETLHDRDKGNVYFTLDEGFEYMKHHVWIGKS